jgi:hypothetical protein
MERLPKKMPTLRLAFVALFLIALVAVFVVWSEVAGQDHLDLLPWYIKLGLGAGIALATVKATSAAVSGKQAWNSGALKWFGVVLLLLAGCALASWYAHVYLEQQDEEDQPEETVTSSAAYSTQVLCGTPGFPYRATSSNFSFESVPLMRSSRAPLVSRSTSRPSACVAPRPV